MPIQHCPSCRHEIAPGDMNLTEGVALCPGCGKLTRLADLAGAKSADAIIATMLSGGYTYADVDLSWQWRQPPAGCHATGWPGNVVLSASARSIGNAIAMAFVALFWNGIVSVFVVLMLAGLYANLIGPLPDWASGLADDMPLGIALFLVLFLTPFVAIGLLMVVTVLTSLMGTVRLEVHGHQGKASTGIGPLRWSYRFDVNEVVSVRLGTSPAKQRQKVVAIEAKKWVRFGSMLPDDRILWMASAASVLLMKPDSSEMSQLLSLTSNPGQHV